MDCAEDEVSLHGECQKCPRCPPGHELRQECGYGLGGDSVCGVCERRRFKEGWGSHSCRLCQTCLLLNRQEIAPCTHTRNAVCGDCLRGFYSKRRLDGLRDLECLPCDSAHFRHAQCAGKCNSIETWTSEAPPLNAAFLMTGCLTAIAMASILLVVVILAYRGFDTVRKTFKGCLSPCSQRDIAAASVSVATEYSLTQEAAFGCSDCPLAVERSAVAPPGVVGVVCQVTGPHEPGAVFGRSDPVECTEREILNGERERERETEPGRERRVTLDVVV